MKTLKFLFLAGALAALSSCDESSYEVHQTFFYPQIPGGMQFYADQTSDTIHVYSLDSWTSAVTQEWMDVTPKSYTVQPMSQADTRLTITTTANTTGAIRTGSVTVSAHDVVSMGVTQFPWLNIIVPDVTYYNSDPTDTDLTPQTQARFDMSLNAATRDTLVVFRVYQDGATLASDASWIAPEQTTFSAGRDTVRLSITPNTATEARTAKLTLTSAGVSTVINVRQPALQ